MLDLQRAPNSNEGPISRHADCSPLTQRELEALKLVAKGYGYAEISALLGVSVHTTATHLRSVYSKLSVHSKNEAVYEATLLGLIPAPSQF